MNRTTSTGQRYTLTIRNGETTYSPVQRFGTFNEAADYAEPAMIAGQEAVITDTEGNRPTLAVRTARS